MRVISIANFKGGTGKTVTACNLAALLARDGLRVLLIDADAQHNSTDFFGGDTDAPTLTDVLEGTGEQTADSEARNTSHAKPRVAIDYLQETELDNLDLLAADMGLLRLDLAAIMSQANAPLRRFDDFLDAVREQSSDASHESPRVGMDGGYDFVIIDCPPSFTAASVAALVNSDEVILPTRGDAFSRAGVLELVDQLQKVGLRLLRPMPRIRVLVTMADARASLPKQIEALFRRSGFEVFRTVIRSGIRVSQSTWQRTPLYLSDPKCKPAQDYEALAKEVRGDE